MNNSNIFKHGMIIVAIWLVIITFIFSIAQQKQFFYQTLVITLFLVGIVVSIGKAITIDKLKGPDVFIKYDNIIGTLTEKPEPQANNQIKLLVSLGNAYVPPNKIDLDMSIYEIWVSMITRTTIVSIICSKTDFKEVKSEAPQKFFNFYGSIFGNSNSDEIEAFRLDNASLQYRLDTAKTQVSNLMIDLEKEVNTTKGSLAGQTNMLKNIRDQLGNVQNTYLDDNMRRPKN